MKKFGIAFALTQSNHFLLQLLQGGRLLTPRAANDWGSSGCFCIGVLTIASAAKPRIIRAPLGPVQEAMRHRVDSGIAVRGVESSHLTGLSV